MKQVVEKVKSAFGNTILAADLMQTTDDGAPLWPMAPYNATQQSIDTYIQGDVNKNKMLVPSEDGKGMYVYMTTTLGIPVQLRTKDKRPLFIAFDTSGKRHNYPVIERQRDTNLQSQPPEIQIPINRINPPKSLSNMF